MNKPNTNGSEIPNSSNRRDLVDELLVVFTNVAPENKEWSAHVHLLNEWTTPDRYLRSIIQAARSGQHFPADMHVNLIEQVIAHRVEQVLNRLEASKPRYDDMDSYNRSFLEAMYKGTIDKAIQAEREALKKKGCK